jgi:3-hydroxyisobutyrate dehydrogenase
LTDTADAEVGPIAFLGLGMMGLPMTMRLIGAGFAVRGSDLSEAARRAFEARGGRAFAAAKDAAEGTSFLITMLPDGAVVRDALLGSGGAAKSLKPGALVIDMSSSAPLGTRRLAEELAAIGVGLIDAPVSGGVKRAADGSLAIMAGGEASAIVRARPFLQAMGKVFETGPVGSGHAIKALNNYVSAAGLAAACEAVLVAERFGIDPAVLVDVLNASTGRNNSTELKLKPFILSGSFASGFSMALMAKDLRTAADLAGEIGVEAAGARSAAELWTAASAVLGKSADHTEIHRFLAGKAGRAGQGD